MRKNVVLFILLLPFLIISLYNFPTIDDFWNGGKVIEYGRIGSGVYFYENISGRYFSLFLMGLLNTLPAGQFWIFQAWPILVMGLLHGSFSYLLKSIFQKHISNVQVLTASFTWLLCYLCSTRSLYDVWYWMSSSICYQSAIITAMLLLGAFVRWFRDQKPLLALGITLFVLILPGCSELMIPFLLVITGIVLIISKKQNKKIAFPIFWVLLAIIASVLAVLSGGAQMRSSVENGNYTFAVLQSIKTVGYYLVLWAINPVNILAFLWFVPRLPKINSLFVIKRSYLLVTVLLAIILGLTVYVPIYLFGFKFPPPRITSLWFFVSGIFAVTMLMLLLKKYRNLNIYLSGMSVNRIYTSFVFVLFIVMVIISPNFRDVTRELVNGKAASYHSAAAERFNYLQQQKADTVLIKPITEWSFVLTGTNKEVTTFKAFRHYRSFFKKKEIIISDK